MHPVYRVVLVCRKDGGLRVCADYRRTNKDTVPECFPMSHIDDLVYMVSECKGKVFSTLDLMKGYHQIRMHPELKEKIAFTYHAGHFQYRRMVYLDDLLVVSKSFVEQIII